MRIIRLIFCLTIAAAADMDAISQLGQYPQWASNHEHAPFPNCLTLIPKDVTVDENKKRIVTTITFGTETIDIALPRGTVMARFPFVGEMLDGKDNFIVCFGVYCGELNLKLFNCSAPMSERRFIKPLEPSVIVEHSVTKEAEHASSDERTIGIKMSLSKDPSLLTEDIAKLSEQQKGKGVISTKYTTQHYTIRAQGDDKSPSWVISSINGGSITGSLLDEEFATLAVNGTPFAARVEFKVTHHEAFRIEMVSGVRWDKVAGQGQSTTILQLLKKYLFSLTGGCLASKKVCSD